jgi:hypothetical protein
MVHILAGHFWKSVRCYRLTAFYFIAGVALATLHTPVKHDSPPDGHFIQQEAVDPSPLRMPAAQRLQMNFGDPPSAISVSFHIARIVMAGWIAFLGVFWDVRRRMKEWALIRLYGGYPSLVAGFQYLCLAFMGMLVGCGFALLTHLPLAPDDAFWLAMLTLAWGVIFSICVSVGPVVYTEFCDVVRIFRIEGEVR